MVLPGGGVHGLRARQVAEPRHPVPAGPAAAPVPAGKGRAGACADMPQTYPRTSMAVPAGFNGRHTRPLRASRSV